MNAYLSSVVIELPCKRRTYEMVGIKLTLIIVKADMRIRDFQVKYSGYHTFNSVRFFKLDMVVMLKKKCLLY